MNKVIVGVADMKISDNPQDLLITYGLGSCLGVAIYDSCARVGGILHVMLPDSNINCKHEALNPLKFVDTGLPLLFKGAYTYGAQKKRIQVKMAGCAQIADESGFFNIGKRNYAAAHRLLWKNEVLVDAEHCGAFVSRTISLEIASGKMLIQIGGETFEL